MKTLVLLIFCSFSIIGFTQTKTDLCLRVDSLVANVLNFKADKKVISQNNTPKTDSATTVTFITNESAVVIPDYPLIIINKKLAAYAILNNYSLKEVKDITVLGRNASIEAYGPQGLHGSVLITLQKKK